MINWPPNPPSLTQEGVLGAGSGLTDRGTPLSATSMNAAEMTFQVPVAREKDRDTTNSSVSSKKVEVKSIDLPAPLDNPFLEFK